MPPPRRTTPVTDTVPLPHPLPLRRDAARLGLRRIVVPTSAGEVVVHTGRETGGPATILLHGAAGSWTTWTPLLAASDASSAPLTDVVAIDLPGWGDSGGPAGVRSVDDASDAVVQVARALGFSSWRVVGHSLGGFVALDVAARHPEDTLGVTLVSATGAGAVAAIRRPLRGGLRLPWFAGMLLTMRTLAALGRAGGHVVRLVARLGWLPALSSPLFAGRVHPSVVAALAEEVRPGAFAHAARLAAAYDVRRRRAIACPVRAVRGEHDVFAGDADAEGFAAVIRDFSEVRVRGAGHFAHIERTDAVLAALAATTRLRLAPAARRGLAVRPQATAGRP